MLTTLDTMPAPARTRLDRVLSVFTDVRAGEGVTALLMLVNVFVLLTAYAVIKTVREPLILLGGGAEVRSYAAAGQALLLIGYVPLYSWVASKVNRMNLVVGVSVFFIVCIELFAAAVTARVPYVGVGFFIWVGIYNISLVAQFWSFANDIFSRNAGERLFPIVMVGMTAGAPIGSFIAARLFRLALAPELILQVSAVLLVVSVMLYVVINRRIDGKQLTASREESTRESGVDASAFSARNGFQLVLGNRYLLLVAALVALLNVVNTTGEYMVAKLLTAHVNELAALHENFDKRAYIGAFSGEYQFWVNISAFFIQAFVTSRLVKFRGLAGLLLVLPLIALGGYAMIAAGAGVTMVRWIKTAENATDYSIMNTARQLLWLPTSREEKYKAKQAIDTFFVRAGDVMSALMVLVGTTVLHLAPSQFAVINVALTCVWLAVAVAIVRPVRITLPVLCRPLARVAATLLMVVALATPLFAQETSDATPQTREAMLAGERAEKATRLHPYVPDALEQRIDTVNSMLISRRPVYPFIGSVIEGGGLAAGPAFRHRLGTTGAVNAYAAWSFKNFGAIQGRVLMPEFRNGAIQVEAHAAQLHAPGMPFYGQGAATTRDSRQEFALDRTTFDVSARVRTASRFAYGGSLEWSLNRTRGLEQGVARVQTNYQTTSAFAEVDWRTSPFYTKRGGLLRATVSDNRQINSGAGSFQRLDAEAQQFIPLGNENWVIALRALASTTYTNDGNAVPFFMLPELGGSHILRGYAPWRFRDRNRLLFSGEYRWSAGPLIDMAIFLDAGSVAPRPRDLDLRSLHTSHGIGMTVHTPSATVTRVELARSREGMSLLLSFSPSF